MADTVDDVVKFAKDTEGWSAEELGEALLDTCQNAEHEATATVAHLVVERSVPVDDLSVFFTCRFGHAAVLKILLENGGNASACNSGGFSAMYSAAEFGHFECVQLLIQHGGSVTCVINGEEGTALYGACRNGHAAIVKLLVEAGAQPDMSHMPFSALYVACEFNHQEIVRHLLAGGADPDNGNESRGFTPLGVALEHGNEELALILLEGNASPDKFHLNDSPRAWAQKQGCGDAVMDYLEDTVGKARLGDNVELFARGTADWGEDEASDYLINVMCNTKQGGGPVITRYLIETKKARVTDHCVFTSCRYGHAEVLAVLLEHGGNPSAANRGGFSAMYSAAEFHHFECIKLLIKHGAEMECVINGKPGNALYEVCRNGHKEIIKVLIENGADPNASHMPYSALFVACEFGHKETVRMMLDAGADPDRGNAERDYTPLGVAIQKGFVEVAQMLLEAGCNPTKTHSYTAPLAHAKSTNDVDLTDLVVRFLKSGGHEDDEHLDMFVDAGAGDALGALVAQTKEAQESRYIFEPPRVYCSGQNSFGNLGLGTKAPVDKLTLNTSLSHVVVARVECGASHTVMVDEMGSSYSCGRNNKGQLGLGSTIDVGSPTLIPLLAAVKVVDVACGDYHTLWLSSAKVAYAGGDGSCGQLGVGTIDTRLSPVEITSLSAFGIADMSAGGFHSAAITESGVLYTWGEGSGGQLGHGRNCTKEILPKKANLGRVRVKDVACGAAHTAIVTVPGCVMTTGKNMRGQLGLGDEAPRFEFTEVTSFQSNPVAAVSCGMHHTAALATDGKLYVWGSGARGQLGFDASSVSTPQVPPLLASCTFSSVTCGASHTLAVSWQGEVVVWGHNTFGQLGLNDARSRPLPSIVGSLRDKGRVVSAAGGEYHSAFVLEDGSLYTCGMAQHGQLALGNLAEPQLTVPRLCKSLHGQQPAVFVGLSFAVALCEDGLQSFGRAQEGQLGLPISESRNTSIPRPIPGGLDVRLVACGAQHVLAVVGEDSIFSWGSNSVGQLGREGESNAPAKVDWHDGRVVSIACGRVHSMAVSGDGHVYEWGKFMSQERDYPSRVVIDSRALVAASGDLYMAVLCEGGAVYTRGRGDKGQLGIPPRQENTAPRDIVQEFTRVINSGAIQIACAKTFMAVVTEDGDLLGCGKLHNEVDVVVPTAMAIPGNAKVARVACGDHHMAFVTVDGKLYAMGDNSKGALGLGDRTNRRTPARVDTEGLVALAVACGGSQTFVTAGSHHFATGPNAIAKANAHIAIENIPLEKNLDDFAKFLGVQHVLQAKRTPYTKGAILVVDTMDHAHSIAGAIVKDTTLDPTSLGLGGAPQTFIMKPCVVCARTTSDEWFPWQAHNPIRPDSRFIPLLFDRLVLYEKNFNSFGCSALVCKDCNMQLAVTHGFVDVEECRKASNEHIDRIQETLERTGLLFTDPAFGPHEDSLWRSGMRCGDPELIMYPLRYMRAGDVAPNPQLVTDGIDPSDVEQGAIGTCYLLGSLAVMATRSGLVEDILFGYHMDSGVASIRFASRGAWKYYLIDDWVACGSLAGNYAGARPIYGWSTDRNEFFVMFVEKAYAKFKGSFEAIDGGIDRYAMVDITGGVCDSLDFRAPRIARDLDTGAFWETMLAYIQAGKLMSCSIDNANVKSEHKLTNGLLCGHAYAVTGTLVVGKTRLVRVRNPHGEAGWTGDYSTLMEEVMGRAVQNDGEFFMSFKDFTEQFNMLDVTSLVHEAPSDDRKSRIGLESIITFSGDSLVHMPVYHLKVMEDNTRIVVELQQPTGLPAEYMGHEVVLLVCQWREGMHYALDEVSGPRLFSDLRTAKVVGRIYPTRDINVSLELFLWPQMRCGYFILPSATGHADFDWQMKVFSSDPTVKVTQVEQCGIHSESESEYSYSSLEDAAPKTGTGPAHASVRRAKGKAVRRARGKTVRRARGQVVRRARGKTVRRSKKVNTRRNARDVTHRLGGAAPPATIPEVPSAEVPPEQKKAAPPTQSTRVPGADALAVDELAAQLAAKDAQIASLMALLAKKEEPAEIHYTHSCGQRLKPFPGDQVGKAFTCVCGEVFVLARQ